MARINVIPALLESQKSSNTQEWCFSPDLESEITTLAAWCDVKQQQREPLSSSIENSEEDWSESIDEKCTSLLTSLSLDGDDADIKKDFLDRLAELLCYRKDPYLITSTGLIYNEEEVTIVGARNSPSDKETWLDKDIKMLEYLGELLERISSDDIFESHPLPALQSALIEYYSQRIKYHAQELAFVEKGKTDNEFFKSDKCGDVISGRRSVYQFVNLVDKLSYSQTFTRD